MVSQRDNLSLLTRALIGGGFFILTSFIFLYFPSQLVNSANLTSVKNTLQSSRLSAAARVDATGTTVGSSTILIKTTSSAPYYTTSTANLKAGDTVTVGSNDYTIIGIIDDDEFTVNPVLLTGDADDNDPVYLKSRPQHVITFSTASAVPDGYFRVLLPADTTTPNDGSPDNEGFDFNTSVTVTGTDVVGLYDFTTGVATASGGTGCTSPANYHCFEVHYSGAGAVGQSITLTIGNTNGSNTPIAPAPSNSTLGTAETYPYIVRQYTTSGSDALVDTASGRVAFLEGVRVTATVDPTLSMTICGADTCTDVEPGDTVDSETLTNNTGATSTSTSVALGILDLAAARVQAQKINIATNASSGYVLTALDDGNMRKGTDTINDNVTPPTSPAVLNTAGTEAYGIHPSGTHVNTGTWGTGGASANLYSGTDASTPITLASYTSGPTASTATYVTYKANISEVTAQGQYEHIIFYTATATF